MACSKNIVQKLYEFHIVSRIFNNIMEASASTHGGTQPEPSGLVDASETYVKMQVLLKAKDDTSRFVGLALLKSVLDNNSQLAHDTEKIRTLWEALSPKFFDRLLRAHGNEKVNKSEAQDMVDLAVSVLHIFSIILPEESQKEKRLTGRTPPLVKALVERYSHFLSCLIRADRP